jgi:hypothetical protein
VGVALANLASVAAERQDYVRAERLLRETLAIYAGLGFTDQVRVGYARASLGHALLGQKRHAEAQVESLAAYEILNRRASSQSSALPQARRDLADELTALGKPAEAARFRNEAVRAAAP